MAVFTPVSQSAFNNWACTHYGIGDTSTLQPIHDGIENTNYFAVIDDSPYVFTIFELWNDAAVDYYAALMQHLHSKRLPVPAAIVGGNGSARQNWREKPCMLVPFIQGKILAAPASKHCKRIGELLAQMHLAAADYQSHRPNPRNGGWRRQVAGKIRESLSADLQQLLDNALADDARFCHLPLPAAACHCDLFRNNVLWRDSAIAAVIDFYFGGSDSLIYDIAVCACDWCYRRDSGFDPKLLSALIRGYSHRRRLCDLEKNAFIEALGSAALRFWLSRQYDKLFPRQAEALMPHDPRHFEQILRTIRDKRDSLAQFMREAA